MIHIHPFVKNKGLNFTSLFIMKKKEVDSLVKWLFSLHLYIISEK